MQLYKPYLISEDQYLFFLPKLRKFDYTTEFAMGFYKVDKVKPGTFYVEESSYSVVLFEGTPHEDKRDSRLDKKPSYLKAI